jgi:hypothetical protein
MDKSLTQLGLIALIGGLTFFMLGAAMLTITHNLAFISPLLVGATIIYLTFRLVVKG